MGAEVFYKDPKSYYSFSQAHGSEKPHLLRHHDTPELKQSNAPQGLDFTEKSAIIPVHEIQILGYLINSVEMMIMLPSDKIICIVERLAQYEKKWTVEEKTFT